MRKCNIQCLSKMAWCAGLAGLIGWATGCQLSTSNGGPAAESGATRVKPVPPDAGRALAQFHQTISPILEQRCYACHGDGEKKGGIAFDDLTTPEQILQNPGLWLKVLKNTRSHIMPPAEKSPPTPDEQMALEQWIKTAAFGLNPDQPDPGRITLRRLNRTEYRNTIRDLLGVEYDTDGALPAEDVGYGFDNIADVLSISPMRMEKLLETAQDIVNKAVPTAPRAIGEEFALGSEFISADRSYTGDPLSFYEEAAVSHTYHVRVAGDYRILVSSQVDGVTQPDPGLCLVTGLADGKEFYRHQHHWADCEYFHDEKVVHLEPGEHQVTFHLQPLLSPEQQITSKMNYKLAQVQVIGPLAAKDWLPPPNYSRFFPRDQPPAEPAARRAYAREVLEKFATKAYRRPVSRATLDQLVSIAQTFYQAPGATFEAGVSRAMVAVIASPRFLFRFEEAEPSARGQPYSRVDEYALASRLSYFLWSTMPDAELFDLAAQGELRKNLAAQVGRMLADPKAAALIGDFSGQWLQARGILNVTINATEVMAREGVRAGGAAAGRGNARGGGAFAAGGRGGNARGRGPAAATVGELTPELRAAMKQETEAYFGHIVRDNRSVLELLDSDYTYANETLAAYYGLPAGSVTGPGFRQITLPADSPRGGVLTMATTLAVTSNPTRTSPVKRGKWILENILGAPPAPPPPNVPALELAEKKIDGHKPTQREVLARHREDALCASCHARMDPLGLALENFNALGLYRTQELEQPVDATGQLFTGENFKDVRELKHILVTNHHLEFYRTLTEKLLIYALGRGVEYYDVPTVDQIVTRLDHAGGKFDELLLGIIESAPFQQRRREPAPLTPEPKAALVAVSDPVP